MATLPADRTKLALAQANQVPSAVASAQRNIDTLTEIYDTVDLLNQKVDNHANAATLPHADGSVTTAKLANVSVTTPKIADLAVTAAKIANQSLTADKFVPGALTNETQNALRITAIEANYSKEVSKVFNVVGYGADPTGATISDTAIDAAIAALTAAGGGILYFPAGTYLVSKRFDLPTGCYVMTAGKDITIIKKASTHANTDMFRTAAGVYVSGLTVDGQKSDGNVVTNVAFRISNDRVTIENCKIINMLQDAVYAGNGAVDVVIQFNEMDSNTRQGISAINTRRLKARHNKITNSGLIGINLEPNASDGSETNSDFLIEHNYIDTTGDMGIQVTKYARNGLIFHNTIKNTGQSGLIIAQDVQGVDSIDNDFDTCALHGIEARTQNSTTLNYPSKNKFIRNKVKNLQRHGIYIQTNVTRCDILENEITDPKRDTSAEYSYIRLDAGASFNNVNFNRGIQVLSSIVNAININTSAAFCTLIGNRYAASGNNAIGTSFILALGNIRNDSIIESTNNYTTRQFQETSAGNTTNRPTGAQVGTRYFDTSLGKPIWLKTAPSTWVDATGTTV